jgi:hypothetical protein
MSILCCLPGALFYHHQPTARTHGGWGPPGHHRQQLQGPWDCDLGSWVNVPAVPNAPSWGAGGHQRRVLRPRWQNYPSTLRLLTVSAHHRPAPDCLDLSPCRLLYFILLSQCRIPPGTGTGYTISLVTRGLKGEAGGFSFSYLPPSNITVEPSRLHTTGANITITGSNFGSGLGENDTGDLQLWLAAAERQVRGGGNCM